MVGVKRIGSVINEFGVWIPAPCQARGRLFFRRNDGDGAIALPKPPIPLRTAAYQRTIPSYAV